MAKSLGQIHTVNFETEITDASDVDQLDLSGELSKQLQHQVRQGNYFKIVGIDMNVTELGGSGGGAQVSGFLDYYNPTRGRCEAYRGAFAAMRNAMQTQGIAMSKNSGYDFRVNLTDEKYVNELKNAATLDGSDELVLQDNASQQSIFKVHNDSVNPAQDSNFNFGSGFGVYGSTNDFVLNEGFVGYSGNENFASSEFESIPFQLSYSPDSSDVAMELQWRPDPALYIAIMTGLIRVRIDELDLDGGASGLKLAMAVHVAGWVSIMGSPDKKRKSKKTKKTTKTMKKS